MKKILMLLTVLSTIACNRDRENATVPDKTMELQEIFNDSISIRALEHRDGVYRFAGSSSTYGSVEKNGTNVETGFINYNGNDSLEFRSIAVTKNFTYILTAGNPALIYKVSHENDSLSLIYEEEGDDVFYDSMKFWDDGQGIAIGDPQQGCMTVLMTHNGGDSWKKIPCSQLPPSDQGEAAFAASNSNISLVGDHIWIATGGLTSRILHSADRGVHWEQQKTPVIDGRTMTGIYAIDFYDEKLGVAIGGDWEDKGMNKSNKAITIDGGKTWKLMANGEGPGYCSDISFVPGSDGMEIIAVGSPGIWWSGNQGADWKKLSDQGFYTIAFSSNDEGLLAGSNKMAMFQLIAP